MLDVIAVGCGGFIGAVLRYLIGMIPLNETTVFPIKTFLINIIGCILIGYIAIFVAKGVEVNPRLILFIKVGICGGFTTFSTFALESSDLIREGHIMIAAMYMILSVMIGVGVILVTEMTLNR